VDFGEQFALPVPWNLCAPSVSRVRPRNHNDLPADPLNLTGIGPGERFQQTPEKSVAFRDASLSKQTIALTTVMFYNSLARLRNLRRTI